MVQECSCKAKTLLDKTVKEMNDNAKAANTKAWKEAAHMLCVLDGNPEDSCKVPALPQVKPVELSSEVANSCSYEAVWDSGSLVTGGSSSEKGKFFTLYLMKDSLQWKVNDDVKYINTCKSHGMLAIGCGGSWDCAQKTGVKKCMSMPDGWSCAMTNSMVQATGFSNVLTFCASGSSGCSTGKYLYTWGSASKGYPSYQNHHKAVCGKYT